MMMTSMIQTLDDYNGNRHVVMSAGKIPAEHMSELVVNFWKVTEQSEKVKTTSAPGAAFYKQGKSVCNQERVLDT